MRSLLVFLLLAVALPLRAQDTTLALPGVVVSAPREAAQTAATGRAVVLDRAAIRESSAATLADLLTRRGGVFVRSYGPSGLASPSLRGTGAAQTLVLLDGFRLNDPQLGQVDLSLLPTALLDRAEVLHGAASAWHGTDALGGVITLSSRRPEATRLHAEGESGAYGLRGLTGLAEVGEADRGVMLSITHRQATGDFPFEVAGSGPLRRRNADLSQTGLLASATLGRLRAGLWLTDAERGLPGTAGAHLQGERQYDQTARLWLRTERPIRRGTLRGGLSLQQGEIRYVNPLQQLDETGRTRVMAAEVEARRAAGGAWLVGAGLAYGFSRATHPGLADAAHEHRGGAFAYAEGRAGRLHVAPSLRLDAFVRPGGDLAAISPRLGLGFDLVPGLRLMASAARAFRAPTFNDRFWRPGGNPDLKPEHGWTFDAGLRLARGTFRGEITGFSNRIRDEIVWLPGPGDVSSPENIGRVQTLGAEISAEITAPHLPGRPHAGAFYTFTDARDRSDPASATFGKPLRYVPREQARLYGGAALGPVAVDAGLRYTGRRYARTDGRDPLRPFMVADVQVRFETMLPAGRLHAALVVENALDAHYSVLKGHPMPPRHLRFRLGYTWSQR